MVFLQRVLQGRHVPKEVSIHTTFHPIYGNHIVSLNILSECDKLTLALTEVFTERRAVLPPKAQQKLDNLLAELANIKASLVDIDENVTPLTSINTDEQVLADARSSWESLPAGAVRGDSLKALVNNSSLALKFLSKGSVDVYELYKFSNTDVELAKQLGPDFKALESIWADWRYNAKTNRDNHFIWIKERGELAKDSEDKPYLRPNKFFKNFARLVDSIYDPNHTKELQFGRKDGHRKLTLDADWKEFTWEDFDKKYYLTNRQVRLMLGRPINMDRFDFVSGGWFEAYVQYQFSDRLDRLGIPHEVFARLKYKTALNDATEGVDTRREGGHFSGEIDVVIATSEKILFVECKSGKFSMEDAQRVIKRKNVIEAALRVTGTNSLQVDFLVVHAPKSDSPESIDFVTSHGVRLLNPGEVYQYTLSHFQN